MTDYAPEMMEILERMVNEDKGRAKANGHATFDSRLILQPFDQIHMSTKANYLVKGIIPNAGLVIVWGPPKCGKSFWTFDLVMHIAIGREYCGHRVQQGIVVYCALEGGHGFRNRIEGWRRNSLNGHDGAVPFYLLDVPIDLIAEREKLIAAIRAQLPGRPSAIVIDTLNRALIGDENKSEDMARFIRAADILRNAFECVIIIIHHCGIAGSRPRGHTSLSGADDVQIAIERADDGTMAVRVEHMKDGEPAFPMAFKLDSFDLGLDVEGDKITTCVIAPAQTLPAGKTAGSRITANQARFLDILRDAVIDPPAHHKTTANIPDGKTAISREWLKTCCISSGWLDDISTNKGRAKFSEMLNALAGKRLVGTTSLFVWMI